MFLNNALLYLYNILNSTKVSYTEIKEQSWDRHVIGFFLTLLLISFKKFNCFPVFS